MQYLWLSVSELVVGRASGWRKQHEASGRIAANSVTLPFVGAREAYSRRPEEDLKAASPRLILILLLSPDGAPACC